MPRRTTEPGDPNTRYCLTVGVQRAIDGEALYYVERYRLIPPTEGGPPRWSLVDAKRLKAMDYRDAQKEVLILGVEQQVPYVPWVNEGQEWPLPGNLRVYP